MTDFYTLVTAYRYTKERFNSAENNLNKAIVWYLQEWTDCDTEEIKNFSFQPFQKELKVYTEDCYGKYKTYVIPYDEMVKTPIDRE